MNENVLPAGYAGRVRLLQHYMNYYQTSGAGLAGALHDWQKQNGYAGTTARSMQEFLLPLIKFNAPGACASTYLSRQVLEQVLSHFTQTLTEIERFVETVASAPELVQLQAQVSQMCSTLIHICDVAEVHVVLTALIKLHTQIVANHHQPPTNARLEDAPMAATSSRTSDCSGLYLSPFQGAPVSPNWPVSPAPPVGGPFPCCGCVCAPTRTFVAWSLATHHHHGAANTNATEVEAGEVLEPVRMPMAAEMKRKAVSTLSSWIIACKHSAPAGVVDHRLSVTLSGVTQWNAMFIQSFMDSAQDEFLRAVEYGNRVDRLFCATLKQTMAVINGKGSDELFARSSQTCVASSMLAKSCMLLVHKILSGGLPQTSLRMIAASLSTIYCGALERPKEFTCIFGTVSPTPIPMDRKVSQKAIKSAIRALFPVRTGPIDITQPTGGLYLLDENRSVAKLRVDWHAKCCLDFETRRCAETTVVHNLLSFIHKATGSVEKSFTSFLLTKVMNVGVVMEMKAEGHVGFTISSLDLLLILQSPQFLQIAVRSYIVDPHAQLEKLILFCMVAPLIGRLVTDQSSSIIMSCLHSLALMLESGSKTPAEIKEIPLATGGGTSSAPVGAAPRTMITVPLHRLTNLISFKGNYRADAVVENILGGSSSFPSSAGGGSGSFTRTNSAGGSGGHQRSPTLQSTPNISSHGGVVNAVTTTRTLGPKEPLRVKPEVLAVFESLEEGPLVVLRECAAAVQKAVAGGSTDEEKSYGHLRTIRSHMDSVYSKWNAVIDWTVEAPQSALSYSLSTQLHRTVLVALHSMNKFSKYISSEVSSLKVLGDGSSTEVLQLLSLVSDEHAKQQLACRWLTHVLNANRLNYSQAATCFRLVREMLPSLKTNPRCHLNVIQCDEIETTHKVRSWLHFIFAGHRSLENLDDSDLLVYTKDIPVPSSLSPPP